MGQWGVAFAPRHPPPRAPQGALSLGLVGLGLVGRGRTLASGESLKEALTLMNMPLETPNLSAFLSARSFCGRRRGHGASALRVVCGRAGGGEGGAGEAGREGGAGEGVGMRRSWGVGRRRGTRGNPGRRWR